MNKHIMWKFLWFAFKTYKTYFVLLLITSLVTAGASIFGAYTISLLISFIEKGNYQDAIFCGIFVTAVEGLLFLLKLFLDKKTQTANEYMQEKINHRLALKITSLPFQNLEDPYYIELKKNAQMGINNMGAIQMFLQGILTIFSNVITMISLGVIIASFNWVLLIALALGIVLSTVITLLSTKVQIKFFKELLPINFKYSYYLDALYSINNAKDFRFYKTYEVIDDKFITFCDEVTNHFGKLSKKRGLLESSYSTIQYLVMGFVYIVVGITTIKNSFAISAFSLTVSSAISFSACVSAIINSSSNFMRAVEYVKPVMEFMNIKEDKDVGEVELKNIDSISFENVSFSYPKTEKLVLDNVSFTINKDEKISIVGLNGAGKTTIVKLLCKLYRPNSGVIKINGLDIYQYSYESYMRKISTVFQDFKLFNYSILDNIAPNILEEEAIKLSQEVGLYDKIKDLPMGINSNLGKDYEKDGVELSGGQMQKIAIARAIHKPADLLILDEPTSALDPIAEAEIYENFNQLAQNRMAIYISHRMSSSIFCDKILVLNEGKIEDFAPHNELMKKEDSLYYKLFMTQAENYRN